MFYRNIAACVCAGVLVVSALMVGRHPAWAQEETGPTITIGAPALLGRDIRVPINASGSGFSSYTGFSLHLRWDPTVFTFAQATSTGGLFDSDAGKGICVFAAGADSAYDSDGGGVIYACSALKSVEASDTGLLATVFLTPKGRACSRLHPTTLGGADSGDTTSGSYTISKDGNPQMNQYADGSANENGSTCGPAAAVTLSPAVANVPATQQAASIATAIAQGTPQPSGFNPTGPSLGEPVATRISPTLGFTRLPNTGSGPLASEDVAAGLLLVCGALFGVGVLLLKQGRRR